MRNREYTDYDRFSTNIFLTGMLTLDKGDAVVVENPTYLGALSAYVPYEAEFIGVDADEEGMIMSELETLQENKNVKLIYVVRISRILQERLGV